MSERQSLLPLGRQADRVRKAYDRFDLLHPREQPLDEGDMQNLHLWMREVTEWVEMSKENH